MFTVGRVDFLRENIVSAFKAAISRDFDRSRYPLLMMDILLDQYTSGNLSREELVLLLPEVYSVFFRKMQSSVFFRAYIDHHLMATFLSEKYSMHYESVFIGDEEGDGRADFVASIEYALRFSAHVPSLQLDTHPLVEMLSAFYCGAMGKVTLLEKMHDLNFSTLNFSFFKKQVQNLLRVQYGFEKEDVFSGSGMGAHSVNDFACQLGYAEYQTVLDYMQQISKKTVSTKGGVAFLFKALIVGDIPLAVLLGCLKEMEKKYEKNDLILKSVNSYLRHPFGFSGTIRHLDALIPVLRDQIFAKAVQILHKQMPDYSRVASDRTLNRIQWTNPGMMEFISTPLGIVRTEVGAPTHYEKRQEAADMKEEIVRIVTLFLDTPYYNIQPVLLSALWSFAASDRAVAGISVPMEAVNALRSVARKRGVELPEIKNTQMDFIEFGNYLRDVCVLLRSNNRMCLLPESMARVLEAEEKWQSVRSGGSATRIPLPRF